MPPTRRDHAPLHHHRRHSSHPRSSDLGCRCQRRIQGRRTALGRHLLRTHPSRNRPRRRLRPHQRLRGRPGRPELLLPGCSFRRGVEDGQQRHHLDAGLRRRGLLLDRLRRTRPDKPRCRLGRQWREQLASAPSPSATASTRASTAVRAGPNMGLGEIRAHRHDRHRPTGHQRRLCRGPGSAVASRRRPRALQDHRRRRHLGPGARDLREHRRQRGALRPARPGRALRLVLPAPASHLDADRRRPRVGDLQVHRRRRHLAEAREGSARRGHGTHRPGRFPGRPRRHLRHRRGGTRTRAASSAPPTAARAGRSMSDHVAGSPQYYNEIVADPSNVDRVYSLETWMRVTEDGGKTFERSVRPSATSTTTRCGSTRRIPNTCIVGCDGGVYESWDRAAT